MVEPRQISFDLGLDLVSNKEDIHKVIEDLSHPCQGCGLGSLHPDNPGLIIRGNPLGWVSFVSEMPGEQEWRERKAMVGSSGMILDDWCKYSLGIDSNKESLIINVVQCKTPRVKPKNDKKSDRGRLRTPDREELSRCYPRCLRVLRAMPNLKCIVCLGATATTLVLGEKPLEKTHMGNWFSIKSIPGVAVYVLPHPVIMVGDVPEEREANVERLLNKFHDTFMEAIELAKGSKS